LRTDGPCIGNALLPGGAVGVACVHQNRAHQASALLQMLAADMHVRAAQAILGEDRYRFLRFASDQQAEVGVVLLLS
jgi:hypothetical protein